MDKVKELVDKQIKSVVAGDINQQSIDSLGKLVDIKKDIAKIEYYDDIKKEENKMRNYGEYREGYGAYGEGYGEYGARGRRGRGRYSEGRGSYGHYMPYPYMYMDNMMDGMEGYMEGREQYNRGNYNGKGQSIESLEKMLDGTLAFVEDILQNPEQKEEHKIVRHYIGKFQELL